MSLIAGVSGGCKPSFESAFREHLRTFPIIRGENPDDYDLDVVEYGATGYGATGYGDPGNGEPGNGPDKHVEAQRHSQQAGVPPSQQAGVPPSQKTDVPLSQDKSGLVIGTRLKKTSMDTISHVTAGGMYVFCLGYNEFLRDAADSPEPADMPEEELFMRIRSSDGEYVAVAVPNPAKALAALKKKSSTGKSSTRKSADNPSGALHIITDRFASRPCFYSLTGGQFRFSTNIAFLIEMIPGGVTLDPVALMQLLNIGHTLSGRTTFREVERMRPAEHLVIHKGRITSRMTYYKPGAPGSPITDYRSYAEQTWAELAASVEKRSQGRKGFVSLSGGLDSRLVAAAADKERFTAFTFINSTKTEDTPEVRAAREVARKLGMKHVVHPPEKTTPISDVIEDVLRLTGGQTAVHHPVKTMSFIRHMQQHGFHMGGGSGGVFAGSEVSSRSVRRSEDRIAGYMDKRRPYTDAFLEKIFRSDGQMDLPGKLRETMRASFEGIDAADPDRKITIWAINEGQAAFTFLSPIHNHPDVAESMPHLGYRYAERMMNLTGPELVNKNFYQLMIYHCLEELRGVRYANSGLTLDSELIARYYPLKQLSRYAGMLTKARRKLDKRLRPGKGVKLHYHYEMVHGDRKALERTKVLLQESAVLRQLFHTKTCLAFIRRFEDGRIAFSPETDANVVSFLITVAHIAAMFPVKAE